MFWLSVPFEADFACLVRFRTKFFDLRGLCEANFELSVCQILVFLYLAEPDV